jgi:deoxyadenosine/deoxycytidine kinase
MGKLIAVVGNTGVGKTTLTKQLCHQGDFTPCLEEHIGRPFYSHFSVDHRGYALANQIDYLLFRAEQEIAIRASRQDGVQDGGLEMDFCVFTRLFHRRGFLNDDEYQLCERAYSLFRRVLPPPDVVIRLCAPLDVVATRFTYRNRELEIARRDDIEAIDALLEEWIQNVDKGRLIEVDASEENLDYQAMVGLLIPRLRDRLVDN